MSYEMGIGFGMGFAGGLLSIVLERHGMTKPYHHYILGVVIMTIYTMMVYP